MTTEATTVAVDATNTVAPAAADAVAAAAANSAAAADAAPAAADAVNTVAPAAADAVAAATDATQAAAPVVAQHGTSLVEAFNGIGSHVVYLMGFSFILGSLFTVLILVLLDYLRRHKN